MGETERKMAAEVLLSSLLGLLFLGLLLPARLTGGVGSLNLEELSEMRYGIQILPLPVMGGQSQASDVVVVSSKYKQRYECRLPAGAIHFQREREEETPAYQGPGIPELLSPMRDAPCLLKTKDWWTYEFCYGRHIQQYHMEDSEIKGDVLYLGHYQSSFNWDDETAKASKQHRLKRYHSQTYGNGSKCDLNGKPREAESKQHEEKTTEEVQDTDRQVWSGSKAAGAPPKKEDVSPAKEEKESELWKLQGPEEQAAAREEAQAGEQDLNHEAAADPAPSPPNDFQNNVQVKLIRSPADLIRLIEELKAAEKGKPSVRREQPGDDTTEAPQREAEGTKAKGKDGEPPGLMEEEDGDDEEEEEEEEEDEEEQQLLGEFEKELEGMLLPSNRERLRSEVKAGMERELENIIQETEKELDPEGLRKESEREQAILALTSTLDKLIKRLQENQSPELVQKYKKRRVVPQKPPPSPHPTGKIEIKIVRPGAEGKEEDTRWLTDEDTRNLKEIFFNILVQGAEEANKERQRQSELESNYRRVWGSPGGEDTGDLDEFDF